MKPADRIAGAISQFEVKAPPRLDERVREHVYEAFSDSTPASAAEVRTRRWRLIAGNRITQLAAAAVIVVTLLLGLHAWDLLGTQAYAVQDTIDALHKIAAVHAFCTDWQGHKFEMWMNPDPATGTNDFICLTEAELDYIVISTPYVSYYYYPGRNVVRIVRGQLITSSLDPARTIESLTDKARRRGDSIEVTRKVSDRYGDAISVAYAGAAFEGEAWVDPKTKLLLGLQYTRRSSPGQFVKSFDEIHSHVPVPDRWLSFQCPDDAQVQPEGWGELDDPNCGIDAAGMTDEHACRTILTRLFEGINAADLDEIRRLIPLANQWDDEGLAAGIRGVVGNAWDDRQGGVAAYEIGSPYKDKACPLGVLVPCVLTDHSDQRFEITLIVRFRQAQGQRTCVVVDAWGDIKPRSGASDHRQPLRASGTSFHGPINGVFNTSLSAVLIVPTNEADKIIEQQIHDSVRVVQKFIVGKFPDRDVKILTDTEALQADLSQSCVGVYGTAQGNLWLAKYMTALPVVIEPNSITADRVYEGSDLRFISAWPHPQNPKMGLVIYTAQRAEDVVDINRVFHGPTDYLVARGQTVVHSANYVKMNGQWTFE